MDFHLPNILDQVLCKYSLYYIVECCRQLIRCLSELENSDFASLLCSWKIKHKKIQSQGRYHQRKYPNEDLPSPFSKHSPSCNLEKCCIVIVCKWPKDKVNSCTKLSICFYTWLLCEKY